jgi:TPR repeat protein/DNA-binding XRE family transcriptional regulator
MTQQPAQQPYPDPLGLLVKRIRENELQVSQADLAWLAGVSRGTISNVETGRVSPDTRTWQRIRTALGLSSQQRSPDQQHGDAVRFLFPPEAVQGIIETILTIKERDPDDGLRTAERWRRLVLRHGRGDSQAGSTASTELSWLIRDLAAQAPPERAAALQAVLAGRGDPATAAAQPETGGVDPVQELASTVSDLADQLRTTQRRAHGFELLPDEVQDIVAQGLVVDCDVTTPATAPGLAIINLVVTGKRDSSLAAGQEALDAARRWHAIRDVAAYIFENEAPGWPAEKIIEALRTGLDRQSPPGVMELLPQARGGDAQAMYRLARLLRKHGRSVEAELWLHRAAEADHPGALFTLGTLAQGRGRSGEAVHWLRGAAEAGHAEAMYILWNLLREEDYPAALTWLRGAAQAGHRIAMYTLSVRERDSGNAAEGERWLRRAANRGHRQARADLIKLVAEHGKEDEAVSWLQRAAEDGDTGAFSSYEVMLYDKYLRQRAAAENSE